MGEYDFELLNGQVHRVRVEDAGPTVRLRRVGGCEPTFIGDDGRMPPEICVFAWNEQRQRYVEVQPCTTSEAAEFLGYSEDSVRRLCEQGGFEGAFRNGPTGHWRIPRASIEKFREDNRPKVLRR